MNNQTSVSSDFSSSVFGLEADVLLRPQNEPPCVASAELVRCRPAFSRSWSFHERIEASRLSISKRLLSARGVERKESTTFVTRRRSTLVSEELRFKRRRASIRCSLMITARSEELELRMKHIVMPSTHLHAAAYLSVTSSL